MKKLNFNVPNNLKVAYRLLKVLNKQVAPHNAKDLILNTFSNCREQGFALTNWNTKKKVLFTENRNSDDIVVYYGAWDEYDITTNLPITEELWEQKKFFDYKDYNSAVNFIKEWLFSRNVT